jgi:hypothetical protein
MLAPTCRAPRDTSRRDACTDGPLRPGCDRNPRDVGIEAPDAADLALADALDAQRRTMSSTRRVLTRWTFAPGPARSAHSARRGGSSGHGRCRQTSNPGSEVLGADGDRRSGSRAAAAVALTIRPNLGADGPLPTHPSGDAPSKCLQPSPEDEAHGNRPAIARPVHACRGSGYTAPGAGSPKARAPPLRHAPKDPRTRVAHNGRHVDGGVGYSVGRAVRVMVVPLFALKRGAEAVPRRSSRRLSPRSPTPPHRAPR